MTNALPGSDGADALPGGIPEAPECPFCGGTETELFNTFGSQLSVAMYWCRACRSPFEIFKWGGTVERPAGGSSDMTGRP